MIEPAILVEYLFSGLAGVVLVVGPPAWVWAALLMAGFAALTVFTMLLARIPTLRSPPPFDTDEEDGDAELIQENVGATDGDDA